MTSLFSILRSWTITCYLRFRRWSWGSGSARLVSATIIAVTFVPCLLVILLEMHATARLVHEIDRGLQADAAVLAFHLERLTLEILKGEHQKQALVGSVQASHLEQRVTPEVVLSEVLPQAYARLTEIFSASYLPGDASPGLKDSLFWDATPGISRPLKPGAVHPAEFVFEIETPRGRFRVGDQAPHSSASTTAPVQMTGTFMQPFISGFFPHWRLHVGFRNEGKQAQRGRYLVRVFPLMVILVGAMLAYRMMQRRLDLAHARSAFVSNVSHELKTPLSAIRLYNNMLDEMDLPGNERREFHEVIEAEVVRLASMVDNVLAFSHIEQGRIQLSLMEVDLRPLLTETVQMFRRLYEGRGYYFGLAIAEALPAIHIDPSALQQVLTNLLDNAVKYSDPQTIWVQVYEASRSEQRFVVLHVQDQGIGIDQDKLQRVFEPFYRAESGLAQRVSGSGLGLAVVRAIVKAHGGRVELDSSPGRGTTFYVFLPVERFTGPEVSDSS